MTRISTIRAAVGALAALALFANSASSETVTIRAPSPPKVNVTTPKAIVHTPTPGLNTPTSGLGKDEVLVGFEHGNARQPYVIGKMYNGTSPAVRTKGKLHH